jgi:hypothetical protein
MTTVSRVFLHDGYTDKPIGSRAKLEHEIERLKMLHWADPGDRELREQIERLQHELRVLNANGASS